MAQSADAAELLAFIDAAPTPYHAVAEVRERLRGQGFVELDARDEWKPEPGQRAFTIQGGGTIAAFVVGSAAPSEAGFLILGAHTDSPNLRIKPAAELVQAGHRQLAIEVYGGVLFSTWLDRDLSLAGRVVLRGGATALVNFERPLCRIPNLAIHLDREVNTRGLILNPQNHLTPTLGLERKAPEHSLRELLADTLKAHPSAPRAGDIVSYDLCLYDTQPSAIGGADGELLFAPRLDNLTSCYAITRALIASVNDAAPTRVAVLYDHEEVGSQSAAGARSAFLQSVLERLATSHREAGPQAAARALARSLLVSVDMAHAVHPNYSDKHDRQHRPKLGQGPVIKSNVNQSYATDAPGAAAFAEACESSGVRAQHFVSKNDMPCGSTIGPIAAARMGVRTVDVGNPMLGMHSCRETSGAADVTPMIAALTRMLAVGRVPTPAD
jgi:aspartyl aminopeptidase